MSRSEQFKSYASCSILEFFQTPSSTITSLLTSEPRQTPADLDFASLVNGSDVTSTDE
jgi:hypothetical protein